MSGPERLIMKEKIKILQPILPYKKHSLFYGGDVCSIKYHGYTVTLRAAGEVIMDITDLTTGSLVTVKDKNCHGIFAEKTQKLITSDSQLHQFLAHKLSTADPENIESTNWWEAIIEKDGKLISTTELSSEYYNEAVEEIIRDIDVLVEEHSPQTKQNKIYVYLEYDEELPFGEHILTAFGSKTKALLFWEWRINYILGQTLSEIEQLSKKDDDTYHLEDGYLSVDTSDLIFFQVNKMYVY